jgi:CHAT domain-containing protein
MRSPLQVGRSGVSDSNDPSHSQLLMHDHDTAPLTVSSLGHLRLDRARLAYLSACETALTLSADLLDEAINLASAFQLAGYPHVIGTLWTINDQVAADIAEAFYAALTHDGELAIARAATALHRAVRATRDRFPTVPTLWAAHIHTGP